MFGNKNSLKCIAIEIGVWVQVLGTLKFLVVKVAVGLQHLSVKIINKEDTKHGHTPLFVFGCLRFFLDSCHFLMTILCAFNRISVPYRLLMLCNPQESWGYTSDAGLGRNLSCDSNRKGLWKSWVSTTHWSQWLCSNLGKVLLRDN